jgi:RNA polymerase-binding transcription factor DksA
MKNAERMCSECGEPISAARLKEIPDTTLCVGCKTKLEKQPKTKTHENPEKVERKSRIRPTHIKPEDVG